MKNQTQSNQKMDPEKAPAPVKKLIEAAKDDLMERRCIEQYIEESSDGTFGTEENPEESSDGTSIGPSEPLSPMGERQPGEWEAVDDKSVKFGGESTIHYALNSGGSAYGYTWEYIKK